MLSSPRRLAVILVALLSGCAGTSPSLKPTAADGVPAWLLPADACPADVMPTHEVELTPQGSCADAALDECLARCQANDAVACYAAALAVEERDSPDVQSALATALFQRACRLGIPSGCTNVAAGRYDPDQPRAEVNTCAARTFAATCAASDPWGCTMFGQCLMHGVGIARDVAHAREVLPGGCRLGEDDPACKRARELLAELDGPPTYPEVTGEYAMTEEWKLNVATTMKRRFEKGALVLWRPGLTAWIEAYSKAGEPVDQLLAGIQADASPKRFDELTERDGALLRYSYRLAEEDGDAKRPALYGFVLSPGGYVMIAIYFDDEAELPAALALWRSVTPR